MIKAFNPRRFHRVFFYLCILFIPTQLGLHLWPSWSFILGRRVDYLSPTLFVTDILILLLLVSWLIESVSGGWYFVSRIWKKKNELNTVFFILLFLFACLNIMFAANRPVALYHWMKVLEFTLLVWYIVKTKPNLSHISYFVSLAIIYSSILAIWQFVLQRSVGGLWWVLGERTFSNATSGIAQIPICVFHSGGCPLFLRSYATFPHPNVLGGFLAVTIPLILNLQRHARLFKFMKWITIGLGMIALSLTFSRSAWAVGAILIIWTVIQNKRRAPGGTRQVLKLFGIFLVVCIGSFAAFSLHATDESVVVREQLNSAAIKIWHSASLTGVGLGNFLVTLPTYLPSRTVYFLQPVHNIYLLLLSEVGVVGIGMLVCIVAFILNHGKKQNMPPLSIRYSLLALLILGLVDHYPVTLQQGQLLLTLFIGLTLISK